VIRLIAAALALAGCKDRGARTFELDIPAECGAAELVEVFLVRDATCGDCVCDDCARLCQGERCELGCPDGPCPIDALDDGLAITPDQPGEYAAIYRFSADDGGQLRVVATACADVVADADGTQSSRAVLTADCCPAAIERDAGVDAP
jgi:hypothetical protein